MLRHTPEHTAAAAGYVGGGSSAAPHYSVCAWDGDGGSVGVRAKLRGSWGGWQQDARVAAPVERDGGRGLSQTEVFADGLRGLPFSEPSTAVVLPGSVEASAAM